MTSEKDNDALKARVLLEAMKQGRTLRPSHVGSLVWHVGQMVGRNRAATDDDIASYVATLSKTHANHFIGVESTLTCMEKLERANALGVKREAANAAANPPTPPRMTKYERKLADASQLTPEMKLDIANRHAVEQMNKKAARND